MTSGGTSTTQLVTLDSCSLTCTANLTEFGEITLSGQVKVNVTYPASATHFEPQRAVALPKEFYHPTLLGNATMAEFLANCSVIENDMGNISEECLAHVFSVTVGYLGGAQGESASRFVSAHTQFCVPISQDPAVWPCHCKVELVLFGNHYPILAVAETESQHATRQMMSGWLICWLLIGSLDGWIYVMYKMFVPSAESRSLKVV